MVKVYRYNTISSIPHKMELEEMQLPTCEPVGEYQVDTSHFVPQCESGAITLGAGEAGQGVYDFKNGQDTGAPVPSNRRHGYTGDIAEASVNYRESAHNAKESVDSAKIQFLNEMATKEADSAKAEAAKAGSTAQTNNS